MDVDVAVLGLGAMGSAACGILASRGLRVAGVEQHAFGHDLGSSAGRTRIIRKAYFEDPAYVPLLERSYHLWHELERREGTRLLDLFGVLMIGRADSASVQGVRESAARFAIQTQTLDAGELRQRFSMFALLDDEIGVFEPNAGIVYAERAILAQLAAARADGAHIRQSARVTRIERGERIHLYCDDGAMIHTERLIVCGGAWTPELFDDLSLPLRVERNVQYWFEPRYETCSPGVMPAFFLERAGWPYPFYGMPDLGDGVKCAFHGSGDWTGAESLQRIVNEDEIERAHVALTTLIPNAAGAVISTKACMYTMTPDGHFALGHHPRDERIVIACGFSGHGFKFAPVIGEIVSDLACGLRTPFDVDFLSLNRLL
jgi:sarcosine oxidase